MEAEYGERENRVQFVTFVCNRRRRLLNSNLAKRIVLGVLYNAMRRFQVLCVGYVIMPNHVHAILCFSSRVVRRKFMRFWKRKSSIALRKAMLSKRIRYPLQFLKKRRMWIHRCYSFTIKTRKKLDEKLDYMHMNPVRAGLVERTIEWPWSSARHYELGEGAAVPITWVDLE